MKSLVHPAAGLALLLWSLTSLSAAPRTSVLASDERLNAPVTLRLRRAPLSDLLAQVSRDPGVPLAASEDTADERVIFFARNRPAREVLSRVAEHFDYSWVAETRKGNRTLVLIQDLAAKRREAELRGGLARDVAALREFVERSVAEVSTPEAQALRKQPLEVRVQRIAELSTSLFGTSVREQDGDVIRYRTVPPEHPPSPQQKPLLERELKLLRAVSSDANDFNSVDVSRSCYRVLSPTAREALWNGEPVTLAFPAEHNRIPLTRENAVDLVSGGLGHLGSRDDGDGMSSHIPFYDVERVRVTLSLRSHGSETRLEMRLRTVGSYGDRDNHSRIEWVFRGDLQPRILRPPVEAEDPLDLASRRLVEPIALERSKVTRPALGAPPGAVETPFEAVLEELADRIPYAVLADGYQEAARYGELVEGPKPLSHILERCGEVFNQTCRFDGIYLRFRHLEWATKRAMEPPARAVRRWEANIRRYGSLRFEDTVEIGGRLTPDQAETFATALGWREPRGLAQLLDDDLRQSGAMLRLLYAIPAPLRRRLEAGQEFSLRQLPAACLRPASQVFGEAADSIHGYEELDDSEDRYVAGTGFAREDELEQRWLQSRISLRRVPQKWAVTGFHYELIEQEADFKKLLEGEVAGSRHRPRLIEGERVDVVLTVPGVEPVTHFFLNPTQGVKD